MVASGKRLLSGWRALPLTPGAPCGGSANRNRSAARLPGVIRPVRSRPSRVIITRGPTLRVPVMRSGSETITPGDAEILAADVQHVAGAHVEAHQQIVGHDYGLRVEGLAQRPRRIQLDHAIVRIRAGSTAFTEVSSGSGVAAERRHGHGFGDPGATDAARVQTMQHRFLFRGGQGEDAQPSDRRPSACGPRPTACGGRNG